MQSLRNIVAVLGAPSLEGVTSAISALDRSQSEYQKNRFGLTLAYTPTFATEKAPSQEIFQRMQGLEKEVLRLC